MSSIKLELDEYLARKDDTKPLLKNGIGLPGVSLPNVGSWFKREPIAEESWFSETQKDCCPKMVNIHLTKLRLGLNRAYWKIMVTTPRTLT